jgi:hypothetical protein
MALIPAQRRAARKSRQPAQDCGGAPQACGSKPDFHSSDMPSILGSRRSAPYTPLRDAAAVVHLQALGKTIGTTMYGTLGEILAQLWAGLEALYGPRLVHLLTLWFTGTGRGDRRVGH